MPKSVRALFSIKQCSADDPQEMEDLLNEMSRCGWELYSMHESEGSSGYCFNCIFVKEYDDETEEEKPQDEIYDYKTPVEKLMRTELEPYEQCKNIQQKIKEKRQQIAQIKSLIDSTSEDQRQKLNSKISKSIEELEQLKKNLKEVTDPDKYNSKLGEERIKIRLSEELIDLVNPDLEANLIAQIVKVRDELTKSLGYIIPKIKVQDDDTLAANEFSIDVRGVSAIKGFAYPDYQMFSISEVGLTKLPKGAIKTNNLITNDPSVWLPVEKTKDYWCQAHTAADVIGDALKWSCISLVEDILDYNDINRYVEIIAQENMFLIENIIPDFISVGELKYILSSLIKEKISVKDIVFIFEKINDYAQDSNKDELLGRIRTALARQITNSALNENNIIQAFELSSETEAYFIKKSGNKSKTLSITAKTLKSILQNVQTAIDKYEHPKEIVIIAPFEIRQILFELLASHITNLKVLSRSEITQEALLQIIGKI